MKKLISLVLCFMLLLSLSVTAFAAEFTPSKSVEKDTVIEAVPKDETGKEIDTQIKVVAPEVDTGDRQAFKHKNEPIVLVTDVVQAMEAVEKEGEKTKDDKITDTGLTHAENKNIVQIFEKVKETESTEKLLEEVGIKAEDVLKAIPAGTKANDYIPAAMFDVSLNEAAQKVIGEKGSIQVKVSVVGVKAGDKILVMKLAADGTVIEGEFLEAVVNEDGTITFTMIGSGPVLVLVNPTK